MNAEHTSTFESTGKESVRLPFPPPVVKRLVRFRKRVDTHVFSLTFALFIVASASNASAQSFAIEHVSVLTMGSPRMLEDQTVLISEGRVTKVDRSSRVRVPADSQRISGRGKYLLPGLADMHVHLQSPIDLTEFLINGVTTAFDLNGKSAYLQWRTQIKTGKILGPQLFLAGPYFRDPEPVGEAVQRVDEIAAAGYDAIKIKNDVTREEFDAIVEEAKKKNLLILGHTPRLPGLRHALELGLNLAHEEELLYGAFSPDGVYGNVEHGPDKVREVVEEVKSSNTFLIPNVVMYDAIYRQASNFEDFAKKPEFAYLSPWQKDRFIFQNPYKNRPTNDREEFRKNLSFMKSILTSALEKAGVKMLAGTDAEGLGTMAGFSLVDELQELHESGLTNYEALQTATAYPALFVHQETAFGKVQNGFRADLILVNSNPLEDLSSLHKLAGVFVNGKWLAESELAQMRQSLAARFEEQLGTALWLFESGKAAEEARFLEFNDPYERMGSYLLQSVLENDGFQQLTGLVEKLRATNPLSSLTSEAAINSLGYALLGKKQVDKATQVLMWNAKAFPSSANAQDSVADAYIAQKDILSAMGAYKRALEINPEYGNAGFARQYLMEHQKFP